MNSKKGFTLILSVVTTLIVFILAESLLSSLVTHINLVSIQNDSIKAYNMAEAGLADGIIRLRDLTEANLTARQGLNPTSLCVAVDIDIGANYTGSYDVTLLALALPAGVLRTCTIISTGKCRGVSRTLRLEVFQKSFAQWVFFTNDEGDVWFSDNPEPIDGPVHTNGKFNISGSPVFAGHVSSADPAIRWSAGFHASSADIFTGGLTLGAPTIGIPSSTDTLAPLSTAAASPGGLSLTGNTTIVFNASGSPAEAMIVTNSAAGFNNTRIPLPANGAIYINGGNLNISGTLKGKVTIGSNRVASNGGDINVVDDLMYNDRNADMLQLIAGGDIHVGTIAQDDLEIDAYLVAANGSFHFPDYNTVLKGTLTIFGGMMQNLRGTVGVVGHAHGYLKDYHYDTRMASEAPLYSIPLTDSTGRIVYAKRIWRGE